MVGCITQNVDGLHQAGGLPDDAVPNSTAMDEASPVMRTVTVHSGRRSSSAGETAKPTPRCAICGSILKVTVVFFGETLPEEAISRADEFTAKADAVIAVGSTLGVFPAASYPLEIAARAQPFIIINQGETNMDRIATIRLEGKAGELVPELVATLTG